MMAKGQHATIETPDDATFTRPATLGTGTLDAIIRQTPRVHTRCRLCTIILGPDDDLARGFCLDHATRPEATAKASAPPPASAPRWRSPSPGPMPRGSGPEKPTTPAVPPPAFTVAERSLIRSVASFMPVLDLLRVLNERRAADLGPGAAPYALEQLHAAIRELAPGKDAGADWSGLRRLLAQARRSGVLASITPQRLDDFATVFQLAPAQLMHLRDVIRHAQEDR